MGSIAWGRPEARCIRRDLQKTKEGLRSPVGRAYHGIDDDARRDERDRSEIERDGGSIGSKSPCGSRGSTTPCRLLHKVVEPTDPLPIDGTRKGRALQPFERPEPLFDLGRCPARAISNSVVGDDEGCRVLGQCGPGQVEIGVVLRIETGNQPREALDRDLFPIGHLPKRLKHFAAVGRDRQTHGHVREVVRSTLEVPVDTVEQRVIGGRLLVGSARKRDADHLFTRDADLDEPPQVVALAREDPGRRLHGCHVAHDRPKASDPRRGRATEWAEP